MDGFALLVWFCPYRLNLWPSEERDIFPAMKAELGQSECRQPSALAVREAAGSVSLKRLLKTGWRQSEPIHDALVSRARVVGRPTVEPENCLGSTASGRESVATGLALTRALT